MKSFLLRMCKISNKELLIWATLMMRQKINLKSTRSKHKTILVEMKGKQRYSRDTNDCKVSSILADGLKQLCRVKEMGGRRQSIFNKELEVKLQTRSGDVVRIFLGSTTTQWTRL